MAIMNPKVKIVFSEDAADAVLNGIQIKTDPSVSANNISGKELAEETTFFGGKPFILGVSKLGEGDTWWDTSEKYLYMSRNPTNATTGNTSPVERIDIFATRASTLAIVFDFEGNQYPTQIRVNNVLFNNSSPLFVYTGLAYTVEIIRWNKPGYPVRIANISLSAIFSYDENTIMGYKRGSQSVGENKYPNYGSISQNGDIKFIDRKGEFIPFARYGLLESDTPIRLYMNDTKIGEYLSDEWSYPSNDKIVTVTLDDEIMDWDEVNYSGYEYKENITAKVIFDEINAALSADGKKTVVITSAVSTFLISIKIAQDTMESGTVRQSFNKLCELARMLIYREESGTIVATIWEE